MSSVATCLALWFVIQQPVYKIRVYDIDELRQRLLHVWRGLKQSLIDDAVNQCKCACGLVTDILNILCEVFSVLDELYVLNHA